MSANSSNNKRIAKNSIFMSIRMIIVLLITLYTTRVILKTLGVVDYGVYNVVCGFVSMFVFLNTSMSNGIQRFFNIELGKNDIGGAKRVFNTALAIQAVLALIIIILTESFGLWYLHNKMVIPEDRFIAAGWIFQFSIVSFLFVVMQAPYTAAVIAHERMDFFAIISVLDAVLKLGIAFALPYLPGDNLIVYGALFAGISIANFILYVAYTKKNFEEVRIKIGFQKELFLSMLSFSGWNLFGSFSGIMKEQGMNLVLNAFYGPVVNAARGVAAQVNSGLQSFVSNITIPVRPQIVQSYAQGNYNRTMNLTFSISKLSCYFLYVMALPVVLESEFVLKIWLGENIPKHTGAFMIIIIVASVFSNLNSAISNVVHATGKMKKYQTIMGCIGITTVPLAYLVIICGGAPEMALLTLLATGFVAQSISIFLLKELIYYSIYDYLKKVIIPIVIVYSVSCIIPYTISLMLDESPLRFICVVIMSLISTIISIFIFGINKDERAIVYKMIEKVKK